MSDPTRDFGPTFDQHLAALSEWLDPVTVAAYFNEVWALWEDGMDARETGETIRAAMPDPVSL